MKVVGLWKKYVLTCIVGKDLPLVIENFFLFARFAALHSRKDIKFLSLMEDHPVFPKNVCKNLLHFQHRIPIFYISHCRVVIECNTTNCNLINISCLLELLLAIH